MRYLKQYKLKDYKWVLAISVILITCFSVVIVGSAKESVQSRQFYGMLIGIALMIIISLLDYKWLIKLHWFLYGFSIFLLGSVLLFGKNVNGATRWMDLGFTTFQPSEFVKIFLIVFFAKFFSDHKENFNTVKTLALAAVLFAFPIILILKQPDLSTTISIVAVFLILLYLGGLSYKLIGTTIIIVIPITIMLLAYIVQPSQTLLAEYQQTRVLAWLYPDEYADDAAYQQTNSKIAIGSGQLVGKGLNNNTTTSVKNGNFILEPQTDFIFAIIGEELGFRGCCIIIMFLFFIIMQCIMIGIRAQLFAGKLICYGVASQIGIQAFINIGVATGILPNTGIPLPFISYGLSSLVSMFMGIGFVLNIGLQQKNR
ncbi:MAG: FtsW/RodA/SpoVE family cell cycle protein [Eubacteriales bacterium]